MVNIKSQRRSLFLLDRYFKPRVLNLKPGVGGGGGQHRGYCSGYSIRSPAVLLLYLLTLVVLAMYNGASIKRTLLPYSIQPNRKSATSESFSPLVWEWYRYSNIHKSNSLAAAASSTADSLSSTTTNNIIHNKEDAEQKRPRLLIAQYVAPGKSEYSTILDATSPVNRAYAKMHGCDYVILRGIGLIVPSVDTEDRPPPLNRATFNKLSLLHLAIASDQYDQLLILDSDSIVYDFSKPVTDFFRGGGGGGHEKMVAGHKINQNDPPDTWHINIGVSLWNLRHAETKAFVDRWESIAKWWLWLDNPYSQSDQSSFYATVRLRSFFSFWRSTSSSLVLAVENDFSNGTIVHVMRPDAATWIDVNVTSRVDTIHKYANEVCERYAPACENIDEGVNSEPFGTLKY